MVKQFLSFFTPRSQPDPSHPEELLLGGGGVGLKKTCLRTMVTNVETWRQVDFSILVKTTRTILIYIVLLEGF